MVSGRDRVVDSNPALGLPGTTRGIAGGGPLSFDFARRVGPFASDRRAQTQVVSSSSEDNGPMNNDLRPAHAESDLSVLLIDDDTELCELIQEFFAARGIRLVDGS